MAYKKKTDFVPCPYKEPCFMKEDGLCTALAHTDFPDGKCHFRKLAPEGSNMYDLERSKNVSGNRMEADGGDPFDRFLHQRWYGR